MSHLLAMLLLASANWLATKQERRNSHCVLLDQAQGHQRFPEQILAPAVRNIGDVSQLLYCAPNYIPITMRNAQDEAILQQLSDFAQQISQLAQPYQRRDSYWLVDVFYPNAKVRAKLTTAIQLALAAQQGTIATQLPHLPVAQLAALGAIPAQQAYPAACALYASQADLPPQALLLQILQLDHRELQLHAGICSQGQWQWLL